MKKCSCCGDRKDLFEFNRDPRSPDGLNYSCKSCKKKNNEANRRKNPEIFRESSERCRLKRIYGITPEERAEMVERQGGKCAICGVGDTSHIDHDHNTGKLRELLCCCCNTGLGKFDDSPVTVRKALLYLLKHFPVDES